jgi:hypothetical protein
VTAEKRVKSLPNDLSKYPQLDPDADDDAINSEAWREELERRKRQEEKEEAERMRVEDDERLRWLREAEEEERERKRRIMLDDDDEQHELEFPDLAAIEKAEHKEERMMKNSRTMLLKGFKTVEGKSITEKALKKLEETARKNGLDPAFMAETFGVEKNHNPELLNAIIDKHNHVSREAVKNLFSSSNNPEILQSLFGKHSTTDPERLRELLNDSAGEEIIRRLAGREEGIVSTEVASRLLDKNGKYSPQFVRALLAPDSGMDP